MMANYSSNTRRLLAFYIAQYGKGWILVPNERNYAEEIKEIKAMIEEHRRDLDKVSDLSRTILLNAIEELEETAALYRYRAELPVERNYYLQQVSSNSSPVSYSHLVSEMSAYEGELNLQDYEDSLEHALLSARRFRTSVVIEGELDKFLVVHPSGRISIAFEKNVNYVITADQRIRRSEPGEFLVSSRYPGSSSTHFHGDPSDMKTAIEKAIDMIKRGNLDVTMWRSEDGHLAAIEHGDISRARKEYGYYDRPNSPPNPVGKILGTTSSYPGQFSPREDQA